MFDSCKRDSLRLLLVLLLQHTSQESEDTLINRNRSRRLLLLMLIWHHLNLNLFYHLNHFYAHSIIQAWASQLLVTIFVMKPCSLSRWFHLCIQIQILMLIYLMVYDCLIRADDSIVSGIIADLLVLAVRALRLQGRLRGQRREHIDIETSQQVVVSWCWWVLVFLVKTYF